MTFLRSCVLLSVALVASALVGFAASQKDWEVHDMSRPRPAVVKPAGWSTAERPGAPPSDATVLFDGTNLDAWIQGNNRPPRWTVEDGAMTVTGGGDIRTKEHFGSCQLHIEWCAPTEVKGQGQGRGNSGVFLMGRYEVQILDSFENETYADGQAASLYGQTPPLVNACRGPGEWQSYDIIFRRPMFDAEGKLTRPATITVLHNGVLVQDHFEMWGATAHKRRAKYFKHPDKLPVKLQDHGNPVRFRNIWIRPLED